MEGIIIQDIMTYAFAWIALSLGAGIAAAPHLPVPTTTLWIVMAGAFITALIGRKTPRRIRMTGLLVAVLAVGLLRGADTEEFPDWLIRRAPGIQEVTGTIASYPEIGLDSVSFTLTPDGLPGRLLVTLRYDQPLGWLHYGDIVRVNGSSRLPEVFEGFDYPAYLARQGIFATLFADAMVRIDGPDSFSLWNWGDRLRQRLLQRFRETLPPDVAALAQSLMLGDRSALSANIEDAFSRTGLMHLLAVSGLHLGIFLGGAWWILRWLGLRPRVTYPLVGTLVLLALIVVGPRVSLVRAGLLFAFFGLGSVLADCGWILRRWIHPLNGLAAAAIVILWARPGSLYDAGFQLTVAATGSILLAFSPSGLGTRLSNSERLLGWWKGWQWLARLVMVSAAAQAGAAPIIAWHFQTFHPLSLLVNLVAVPLAGLSLWAGLLSSLTVATPAFSVAVTPFRLLLEWLETVVDELARLPLAQLQVLPVLGVWMAGCVGFLYLCDSFGSVSSWTSNSMSMEFESEEDAPRVPPRMK